MASLVEGEGRDPTQLLIKAENVRRRYQGTELSALQKEVFLGHDELKYVRQLRKEGNLDKAEDLLLKADLSPAVLDELRKTACARARVDKQTGDWKAVIQHLESYTAYANKWRDTFIKIWKQEPFAHTENDTRLLLEAKEKLIKQTVQTETPTMGST